MANDEQLDNVQSDSFLDPPDQQGKDQNTTSLTDSEQETKGKKTTSFLDPPITSFLDPEYHIDGEQGDSVKFKELKIKRLTERQLQNLVEQIRGAKDKEEAEQIAENMLLEMMSNSKKQAIFDSVEKPPVTAEVYIDALPEDGVIKNFPVYIKGELSILEAIVLPHGMTPEYFEKVQDKINSSKEAFANYQILDKSGNPKESTNQERALEFYPKHFGQMIVPRKMLNDKTTGNPELLSPLEAHYKKLPEDRTVAELGILADDKLSDNQLIQLDKIFGLGFTKKMSNAVANRSRNKSKKETI